MFCRLETHKQLTANAVTWRSQIECPRAVRKWMAFGKFPIGTLMASVSRPGYAAVVGVSN